MPYGRKIGRYKIGQICPKWLFAAFKCVGFLVLFGLCLNFGLPHLTLELGLPHLTLGQGVEVFPVVSWAMISVQSPHSQNCLSPSTSEILTWTLPFLLFFQEVPSSLSRPVLSGLSCAHFSSVGSVCRCCGSHCTSYLPPHPHQARELVSCVHSSALSPLRESTMREYKSFPLDYFNRVICMDF